MGQAGRDDHFDCPDHIAPGIDEARLRPVDAAPCSRSQHENRLAPLQKSQPFTKVTHWKINERDGKIYSGSTDVKIFTDATLSLSELPLYFFVLDFCKL